VGGSYEAGLIWRSRWVCDDGTIVECREALALPSTPSRAAFLSRILATASDAAVQVALDVAPGLGRERIEPRRGEDGLWRFAGRRCAARPPPSTPAPRT
jgi:hypothetical protein